MFKKWKEEWLKHKEEELTVAHQLRLREHAERLEQELARAESEAQEAHKVQEVRIAVARQTLNLQLSEVEALQKRVQDRQEDLQNTNDELLTQIRLLEAKASPSGVWAEAFSLGFEKAWDMMLPIMTGGVDKMKQLIHDKAVNDTLSRMSQHIDAAAAKRKNGHPLH